MKVRVSWWMIAIIIGVVGFLAWKNLAPSNQGNYGDFARCLSNKGAIMYGSKYCGHCDNQKKLFGNSFSYINYIECTEQMDVCEQNGISGVPLWEINGQRYPGEQSLETLSDISGCEL